MNKRVKIVATLGPAVEIRGGKKFGDDGYWGEKLDVEASAKNIAKLIEAGANTFRFTSHTVTTKNKVTVWQLLNLLKNLQVKKLVSFLILKDQKSVQNCSKEMQKNTLTQLVKKFVLQLKQGIQSTREVIALNVAGSLDIYDDVEVGRQVLIDDGKLGLRVVAKMM